VFIPNPIQGRGNAPLIIPAQKKIPPKAVEIARWIAYIIRRILPGYRNIKTI
jgi:hypothetical protein